MYDPNICLSCGQPFEPYTWCDDVSGINDDGPVLEYFHEDDLCSCDTKDGDDQADR